MFVPKYVCYLLHYEPVKYDNMWGAACLNARYLYSFRDYGYTSLYNMQVHITKIPNQALLYGEWVIWGKIPSIVLQHMRWFIPLQGPRRPRIWICEKINRLWLISIHCEIILWKLILKCTCMLIFFLNNPASQQVKLFKAQLQAFTPDRAILILIQNGKVLPD